MSTTFKKPSLSRTMIVVIILVVVVGAVVAVVAASMFLGPSLSVTKKNFTPYQSPVSQGSSKPSSMTVSNTNGGVTVSSWSQGYVMINGTVTARGFGPSPAPITFLKWIFMENMFFKPTFPRTNLFFGETSTLTIHVITPVSTKSTRVKT